MYLFVCVRVRFVSNLKYCEKLIGVRDKAFLGRESAAIKIVVMCILLR